MSQTGANSENLLIVARETLLNALEALEEQREALIVMAHRRSTCAPVT